MQLHRVDQLSHLLDDPRGIPSGAGHNQRMTGTGNLDVDRIVHASWAEAAARPGGGHGVQDRLHPHPGTGTEAIQSGQAVAFCGSSGLPRIS
jgi:hypothetical protein